MKRWTVMESQDRSGRRSATGETGPVQNSHHLSFSSHFDGRSISECFSEAFSCHFEGLLWVSFALAFRNILPSLLLNTLFRVISCLMFNVQNGRKFLLGMQTFWFETVWPERKRDIYWFSRGMGILYSTSNSNQWSSQNTGNLREMLVWKRNQMLCLNYVTPFSC